MDKKEVIEELKGLQANVNCAHCPNIESADIKKPYIDWLISYLEKELPSVKEIENVIFNALAEHPHYRGELSKSSFIAQPIHSLMGGKK